MKVYKVHGPSPYVRRFRVFTWSTILGLLVVCSLSIYDPPNLGDSLRKTIADIAIASVGLVIVGVAMFSYLESVWKLKRSSEFEVSADKISQTRSGARPNTEIPLNALKSLYRRPGWLILSGGDPPIQMMIPEEIEGFEELRKEMAKHAEIKPIPARNVKSFLPIPLLIGACALLFAGHSVFVVLAGGISLIFLEGWAFFAFVRLRPMRSTPRVFLLMWLVALLFVFWITFDRLRPFLS